MNLGMLAVILLLANFSYRLWRLVIDRGLRWELHAIRDDLRWLAITDEEVRRRAAVVRFDYAISYTIGSLEKLSIWSLLASGSFGERSPDVEQGYKEFSEDLMSDPRTCELYQRYGNVVGRRL